MNGLSRVFDMLSESAVGLIVFIVVLVFGTIIVSEMQSDRLAEYQAQGLVNCGTNSTGGSAGTISYSGCPADYNITVEGNAGIFDMSSYTGLVVLAIVFVIILGLVFLIKNNSSE